ncbi:MAG: hypothetical protein ACOCU6_03210 [Nanoarchaeota archaeon]
MYKRHGGISSGLEVARVIIYDLYNTNLEVYKALLRPVSFDGYTSLESAVNHIKKNPVDVVVAYHGSRSDSYELIYGQMKETNPDASLILVSEDVDKMVCLKSGGVVDDFIPYGVPTLLKELVTKYLPSPEQTYK